MGCSPHAWGAGRAALPKRSVEFPGVERSRSLRSAKTLERQLRDCHTMLREMEQIEEYREDEAHGTFIAFDTIG